MSVIFIPQNHKYISSDPNENIDWISVTSLVSMFKPAFDGPAQAVKSAKNKKSKWYGKSVDQILDAWDAEKKRATDLGTWYHDQREKDLASHLTIDRDGKAIPIINPIYLDGKKIAPDQKLTEGIYPEHFVYLKSAGVCGQSDRVEVIKNKVHIIDYKTNKEIKLEGFKNWEGVTAKMLGSCSHLDDCNFNHYALQLSIYMYMIIKHNHNLEPGDMYLHHIIFEEDGMDDNGYPITKKDTDGNPIVKEVVEYKVPYLKQEVINMFNYLREVRSNIATVNKK